MEKVEQRFEESLLEIYQLMLRHYGNQKWWPAKSRFEMMIGAILTQNTAWRNVEKVIENLRRENCLTPQKIVDIPINKLALLIKPSGFFNQKAKRLKGLACYIKEHYQFKLNLFFKKDRDALRRELLSLSGIGKETADSIVLYAARKPIFVVDAYTRRIFSRHGRFDKALEYDEIRTSYFEKELDADTGLFNDYHAQIVNVAKDFCKTKARCDGCPLDGLKDNHRSLV